MNIWDRYAEVYGRIMPLISFYNELMEKTSKYLGQCNKILDIGCGTGNLIQFLDNGERELWGVDSNSSMLSYARKKFLNNANVNISFSKGESVFFRDSFMGGIACINVLYYSRNPERILKEAKRILRRGGMLAVSGPRPNLKKSILEERIIYDLKSNGKLEQLREDLGIFAACNKELISEISNEYTSEQLKNILINEIGFKEIVYSDDDTYLGQSHFVLAKK